MTQGDGFVFGDYGETHEQGSVSCRGCWPGFPKKCRCGGWIHAEFLEEYWDDFSLLVCCDGCRYDYVEGSGKGDSQ